MKNYICLLITILSATSLFAANDAADGLAKTVLEKSGVRVSVCEMPQAGDGTLAAALALAGVAQVHALAPDAKAAEAARKPASAAGVMGSQVLIETGLSDALPLGDWVADLYLVADATDASLKTLAAAEAARVLSPYRGVALVGNPAGAKGGLSKAALLEWAKGTGGTAEIKEDATGLWAVVKMPPLKGGDDWGHYWHGPDLNPVSQDSAVVATSYQLQSECLPLFYNRNFTAVVSGGRYFCANSGLTFVWFLNWEYVLPFELVARSLYNTKVLWRRPLPQSFGDMGSLIVATPDRLYLKDGNGVLILNPETGAQIARIPVTTGTNQVRYIGLQDGVLVVLAGARPYDPGIDGPIDCRAPGAPEPATIMASWRDSYRCNELTAWDTTSLKQLWKYPTKGEVHDINLLMMAIRGQTVYGFADEKTAFALDLKTGAQRWAKTATESKLVPNPNAGVLRRYYNGQSCALATDSAYTIFDGPFQHFEAFAAADGASLWNLSGTTTPSRVAVSLQNSLILNGSVYDQLTGKLTGGGSGKLECCGVNPYTHTTFPVDSCGGHINIVAPPGTDTQLAVATRVFDMKSGNEVVPYLMKGPCYTGNQVADGTFVLGTCAETGPGYPGLKVVRPATPTKPLKIVREVGKAQPQPAKSDASDWPCHRADETHKGSSAAMVDSKSVIRWIYTPPGPAPGMGAKKLPAYLERDKFVTEAISVGAGIWFGTAEGAVVRLDRQTGAVKWSYQTAGRILTSPVWWNGRIYAGSADGWVYCLDAESGELAWRFHVAPKERRIIAFDDLSSAWAVQSVLVHNGTVFATAGVMGRLEDGSAMVALNALTGENLWTKTYKDDGEHWSDNGIPKLKTPSAGQLAWYGDKVWWMGGDFGPCVVDPANGNLTSAVDESYWPVVMSHGNGSWYRCSGPEMAILPGGWVGIGRRNPLSGYAASHVLLRAGANGIPAGGAFAPQLFSFSQNLSFTSRELPVWDDASVLVAEGDQTGPPMLYPATGSNNFSQALNALGDSKQVTSDACRSKRNELHEKTNLVPFPLPGCPGKQAVSDELWKTIKDRNTKSTLLYGTPVLSGNALLWTVYRQPAKGATAAVAYNGRMSEVNSDLWRLMAISRADQSVLFTVNLPGAPAPNGMSLTRNGDILVPLVDGRVVCIGSGVAQPLAATTAAKTVPGLQLEVFPTDFVVRYYQAWKPEDLEGMVPMKTGVASQLKYNDNATNTLVWLRGYVNIPATGTYTFFAKGGGNFTILDASERFIVSAVRTDSGPLYLEKGLHPVYAILHARKDEKSDLTWAGNGESLNVQWTGPDIPLSDIPESALSHREELATATQR